MDSPSPPVPDINPQLPTSSHSASHDDKEIHSVGSFENDHQAGVYTLCWENIQEFEMWKLKEEEKNTVEIIKKQHFKPTALTVVKPMVTVAAKKQIENFNVAAIDLRDLGLL